NERRTSVRTGDGIVTAVASNYAMESGIHYAEFQITEGNPFIGIVRPTPNLDQSRYANDNFNFFARSLRDDFLAARTVEWGTGNVHVCYYRCKNGKMFWTNWDDEKQLGVNWEGMEGCETGDCVGMLLNLDEGTLTVYKNNHCLGVMKDGLSGSYCWCASSIGMSALTIERCDPPLA
ncbi:hypothetical protein THAOC_01715, partial [Thalassiosira oceanica]